MCHCSLLICIYSISALFTFIVLLLLLVWKLCQPRDTAQSVFVHINPNVIIVARFQFPLLILIVIWNNLLRLSCSVFVAWFLPKRQFKCQLNVELSVVAYIWVCMVNVILGPWFSWLGQLVSWLPLADSDSIRVSLSHTHTLRCTRTHRKHSLVFVMAPHDFNYLIETQHKR